MFLFFFQAEDGIRDLTVTGVQTCALPISFLPAPLNGAAKTRNGTSPIGSGLFKAARSAGDVPAFASASRAFASAFGSGGIRSEERRVGKECRSRWSSER